MERDNKRGNLRTEEKVKEKREEYKSLTNGNEVSRRNLRQTGQQKASKSNCSENQNRVRA